VAADETSAWTQVKAQVRFSMLVQPAQTSAPSSLPVLTRHMLVQIGGGQHRSAPAHGLGTAAEFIPAEGDKGHLEA